MAQSQVFRGLLSYGEAEESWAIEDKRQRAERGFRRARRLARFRLLREVAGLVMPSNCPSAPVEGAFELALDDLAGLPILPKSLAGAWVREFARSIEAERARPFAVSWEGGRWRLGDGMRDLLRVEVLRALGETHIPARAQAAARLSIMTLPPESCVEPDCGSRAAS